MKEARELLRTMQRQIFELQDGIQGVEVDDVAVDPSRIAAPVSLFSGAHDSPYFAESARLLTASLPRSQHTVLPWAGHLPTLECPVDGSSLVRESLG
ncbi:alpha/beta fold hydrolase [Archangium minus]|uniref:alpha/beta fold hydrolase n=1 Tax=Archangium minus TaxID=83450 RepID=UPI0037C156DD